MAEDNVLRWDRNKGGVSQEDIRAAREAGPTERAQQVAADRAERTAVYETEDGGRAIYHDNDWQDNRAVGQDVISALRQSGARYEKDPRIEQQATLDRDLVRLQDQKPEEVEDWRQIARITVGLSSAEDEEAQEIKNALMWAYGDQLRPHIDVIEEGWWDDNFVEPPEQEDTSFLGWKSKVGKAEPLFEYLDQWGQSALSAIAGIEAAIDTGDEISAGDAIRHAIRQGASAVDISRAIPGTDGLSQFLEGQETPGVIRTSDGRAYSIDRDQDGSLNLREALGKDPEVGGRWLGAVDLIGTILFDPSTYATLGAGSLARVGMKGAEEVGERIAREGLEEVATGANREILQQTSQALGREISGDMVAEMNQRIAQQGLKQGLDETEQRLYQTLVRTAVEAGGGRTTTRLGGDVAERQIAQIRRGGRSGLRMAGFTVTPTGGRIGEVLGRGSDTFVERAARRGVDDVADVAEDIPTRGLDERPSVPDMAIGTRSDDIIDLPDSAIREVVELTERAGDLGRLGDGPATDLMTEVVRVGRTRGVLGQVLDMPMVRSVIDRLTPRNAVAATFGQRVADELGSLMSIGRNTGQEVRDIMIRLGADSNRGGLMRSSIREFGGNQQAWESAINEALSSRAAREAALETVGPKTAQLIETMHQVRQELREVAIRGGATEEMLRDMDSYIPRVLSDAVRGDESFFQQLKNVDDPTLEMSGDRLAESFMQTRTVAEQLENLLDVNEEAYRVLSHAGIRTPEQLFETNPVAAFAARARSAFQAASEVDMLNGITDLTDGGMNLGFKATADDAANLTADQVVEGMIRQQGGNLADFRKVTLADGTVYRIHNDIADALEDARMVFGDPRQLGNFARNFDRVNNMWARSATVFGVNPAFHIRNEIGNIFNAFLGGTRDPSVYLEAGALQRKARNIRSTMRETGMTWDDAARQELGERGFELLDGARRMGVLNDGRSVDLIREQAGREAPTTGSRINPLGDNFVGDDLGRTVGESVENNARLGVYIDQINKGASPQQAADHVKRHLFDYGDLTRFESEFTRRVSRFYTFMRKNTALQAYTLANYPARIANAEAGVQGVVDAIFDGESEHSRILPPWMPGASVMDVGDGQAAIGVDTPFASFEETMQILTGPPNDDPLARFQKESWLRGFVGRAEGLFSGVALGTLDFLEEMESQRDSFTGRPLDPENQMRDTTGFRALSTVLPGMGRIETWGARFAPVNEALQLRADAEGNMIGNQDWQMALINSFAGLQAYKLDDDSDSAGRYTLIRDLEQILLDMKEAGVEVPTIEEMREAGELALKDRVAETLMYGWTEDPETGALSWDDEAANGRLLQLLPKDVRDAFVNLGILTDENIAGMEAAGRVTPRGARPEAAEGTEEYYEQLDHDFGQALSAIQTYLGRDLTPSENWAMVSAFGGALGVRDQENAGFNPFRENRLLNEERSEAEEQADYARKEEIFNRRLAAVGLSWDQALEQFPRISVMQRNLDNARDAGWSDEQIREALYYATDEGGQGWTSRADRAAINQLMTGDRLGGAVPLTTTRMPITTDEDLQKLQTKVWNAVEELRLIYQFEGWGVPTEEEQRLYGFNALTKAEQRALGIDPLSGAPNREDIRSDEQRAADTEAKAGAVLEGIDAPYRWAPSAQPTIMPWEE